MVRNNGAKRVRREAAQAQGVNYRSTGTSVKCQVCNNQTLNPSGRCHLHENSDPDSLATSGAGISPVPVSAVQSVTDEDSARTEIKRLDPETCACTDCLTGYSKPFSQLTEDEVIDFVNGHMTDASSENWTLHFSSAAPVATLHGEWSKQSYVIDCGDLEGDLNSGLTLMNQEDAFFKPPAYRAYSDSDILVEAESRTNEVIGTAGRVTPIRYVPGQNASPIDDNMIMSIQMPRPGDPSEQAYDDAVDTLGKMIEAYQGDDGKWIQPEMVYELHDVVGNGLRPHRIDRYLEDWNAQMPEAWANQLGSIAESRRQ